MTRVWPGAPAPLGATWDGEGTNFAIFSEHATGVDLCLFQDAGRGRGIGAHDQLVASGPTRSGTPICPTCVRGSSTATGCTGRTRPSRATASTRPSCCIDPYAKAISGTIRWSDALSGLLHGGAGGGAGPGSRHRRTAPRACRSASSSSPRSAGATTGVPARRWNRTVIYECSREGHDDAAPRRPRGAARHVPRPRHRSDHRPSALARRDGRRAASGPSLRHRPAPGRDGPGELLGLQLDRVLRARRPLRHRRPRRSRSPSSSPW